MSVAKEADKTRRYLRKTRFQGVNPYQDIQEGTPEFWRTQGVDPSVFQPNERSHYSDADQCQNAKHLASVLEEQQRVESHDVFRMDGVGRPSTERNERVTKVLLQAGVLFLICSPIWAVIFGPRLATLLFLNVCYLFRPNAYTLHGNIFVASLQCFVALGGIWLGVGLLLYETPFLGYVLPEPGSSTKGALFSNTGHFAVIGPIWFGLILWPGLFMMSRFFLIFSAQYGLSEDVESLLSLGSVWLVLSSVLLHFGYQQPEAEIAQGLYLGIPVAFLLCTVVVSREGAAAVGLIDTFVYGFLVASAVPSPHGPGLFEPAGMFMYLVLVVPCFCAQMAIDKSMAATYLDRVATGVSVARKEAAPFEEW